MRRDMVVPDNTSLSTQVRIPVTTCVSGESKPVIPEKSLPLPLNIANVVKSTNRLHSSGGLQSIVVIYCLVAFLYARYFKGKYGKLYIVGKLNKCRFWKKNELPVSSIPQKKMASNR